MNGLQLFDCFDHVVCINLARRSDRWGSFQNDLPVDWPFRKPERFEAIDGQSVQCPSDWNGGDGAWGCYRSHLAVLEKAINDGVRSLLVMEDDALCCSGFASAVERFFLHLPHDWSYIYLGGQHIETGSSLPVAVNRFVYRPFNVNRAHAYALRGINAIRGLYHHLLNFHLWDTKHHVDHRMGELHMSLPAGLYVPHQWLVMQKEGASDINGGQHHRTDFPGAEVLVRQQLSLPAVAVLGPSSLASERLVDLLQSLDVNMGAIGGSDDSGRRVVAPQLHRICREVFEGTEMVRKLSSGDSVRRLKVWAVERSYAARNTARMVGGFDPAFCLLGPELVEAWDQPRFVVLDSSGMDGRRDRAAQQSTESYSATRRLLGQREQFLRVRQPSCLRVSEQQVLNDPEGLQAALSRFLFSDP
ncbi:Glycosyltransferase family 25 (LPS biosynthesis protein) [Rubripirellula lacrimiformis]|uniref:Glycosyltransferase family 25 (LPS biosynthesis protein) n=1 Tax=Rubripirellula lacrimiformis TaxID=1930273 RepID=A0A517NJF4_9BACT|nr:glycosyltransferase family 25 protein [Rubripirellula lacrimiformis]QDT07268.1 Glycosyltransferase family 25 (LPS biosynthesis protein) [Rubripirellula lacrimiformis]